MTAGSEADILRDLRNLLRDFNGREYSGDIHAKTTFFGDLGMASIEVVVLAETLERQYGRSFAFEQFLSRMLREGRRDIEVGEIAEFLHGQLTGSGAGCDPCR